MENLSIVKLILFLILVHFHHGLNSKQKEKIYLKKNQALIKNRISIC